MDKIKTLIVHDDMNKVKEIKDYIEKLDYVSVIGNVDKGEEVMKTILELEPQVVFLKYDMENLDAIEMIEKAHEDLQENTPMFKFISEDLNQNVTSKNYEEENNFVATVKEFGKEGMITLLEEYKKKSSSKKVIQLYE